MPPMLANGIGDLVMLTGSLDLSLVWEMGVKNKTVSK